MHGNVWEWCEDEVPDPMNPKAASHCANRGGGWGSDAERCQARFISGLHPLAGQNYLGLRVARIPLAALPRDPAALK